jgi:hypothetical protein
VKALYSQNLGVTAGVSRCLADLVGKKVTHNQKYNSSFASFDSAAADTEHEAIKR